MNEIPTKINNYNVYNEGERLLGVGEELPLPDFEMLSDTVSGAGILGEVDDPTVGQFKNQEMEIPFRVMDQEAVDLLDPTKATQLTIRGATQVTTRSGDIEFRQIRVVVKGRGGSLSVGKLKRGGTMDTSVKLTVIYVLIEVDGKSLLELGKFTDTYKVNGKDVLAKIKEMC